MCVVWQFCLTVLFLVEQNSKNVALSVSGENQKLIFLPISLGIFHVPGAYLTGGKQRFCLAQSQFEKITSSPLLPLLERPHLFEETLQSCYEVVPVALTTECRTE